MQVLIDATSRRVLASGYNLTPPAGDAQSLVEIDPAQIGPLQQDGIHTLNPDGTITVTPPDPNAVDPTKAAAAAALAQHKAATVTDMVAVFRPLATDPAMQGAAAYMLKMALSVAAGMGIDVQPSDLPADLQAALAALPSGT